MDQFRLIDGFVRFDNKTKKYFWCVEFFNETQQSDKQYKTKQRAEQALHEAFENANLMDQEIDDFSEQKYIEWTKKNRTFVL